MRPGFFRAVSLAMLALPLGGRVAMAQDETSAATPQPYAETVPVPAPPEPQPEAPQEASKTQLSEVVVTATKREQSLRKIPATINAISGEELEQMGARELQDYLKLVPGITLQEGA